MARLTALRRVVLALVLGVIAALGQAPLDWWPATIIALAGLLFVHTRTTSARQAAWTTWFFGVGYCAFALRWIVEPFLVDIARHGWMAPFALTFMAAGFALFWAVAAYLAWWVAPRNRVAFAAFLVWAEVTRSLILTGFPWALIGHIWIDTPIAQLAAFGGPHLLSLITALAALALSFIMSGGRGAVVGAVTLAGLAGVGQLARPEPPHIPLDDLPVVRLIQPNAPQDQKFDPRFRHVFFNRLVDFSGQGEVPDLIIWPETSVPSLLEYAEDDLRIMSDAARGTPLVFGVQRREGARYFNSLVVLGRGGVISDIYDKRHLVPFGEYIPGGEFLARFGVRSFAASYGGGFSNGGDAGLIDLPGIGPAIPLICYEGIFAEEIQRGSGRPRLMILITNDAWFGQAAGPFQHLAQARLRAIEQGLPMVRVANTGVSAVIDARGRITAQIPLGTDGWRDVPLPDTLPATTYTRWGDWPLFGLLLTLMFGIFAVRLRDSD